jgi:precorrin-2 methylase
MNIIFIPGKGKEAAKRKLIIQDADDEDEDSSGLDTPPKNKTKRKRAKDDVDEEEEKIEGLVSQLISKNASN